MVTVVHCMQLARTSSGKLGPTHIMTSPYGLSAITSVSKDAVATICAHTSRDSIAGTTPPGVVTRSLFPGVRKALSGAGRAGQAQVLREAEAGAGRRRRRVGRAHQRGPQRGLPRCLPVLVTPHVRVMNYLSGSLMLVLPTLSTCVTVSRWLHRCDSTEAWTACAGRRNGHLWLHVRQGAALPLGQLGFPRGPGAFEYVHLRRATASSGSMAVCIEQQQRRQEP